VHEQTGEIVQAVHEQKQKSRLAAELGELGTEVTDIAKGTAGVFSTAGAVAVERTRAFTRILPGAAVLKTPAVPLALSVTSVPSSPSSAASRDFCFCSCTACTISPVCSCTSRISPRPLMYFTVALHSLMRQNSIQTRRFV
ncbi:MAG: hypothetical protein ACK5MO_07215, partial [Planctomyces sp.]